MGSLLGTRPRPVRPRRQGVSQPGAMELARHRGQLRIRDSDQVAVRCSASHRYRLQPRRISSMVSRKQSLLISLVLMAAAAASRAESGPENNGTTTSAPKRKFLGDDPLWREPKPRAVTKAKTIEIDNLYDFIEQSFVVPHQQKKLKRS